MKYTQPSSSKPLISVVLLFLGFLEFSFAALWILRIDPDPKNAVFLGYSLSRLLLFLLALVPAIWLLALAGLETYRIRVIRSVESVFRMQPFLLQLAIFSLALLAVIIFITPAPMLGKWGIYFERVRPLLLVLSFYPVQFPLNWWIRAPRTVDWSFLRPALVSLAALLTLMGLILFSGFGLTPEQEHWNVAGIPLTSLQLTQILLAGGLTFGILGLVKPGIFTRHARLLDGLMALALFGIAIFLWMQGPVSHNEFSSRLLAPYFQSFPISDAHVHDIGALSALKGFGIYFRSYTDKPLYMIFLAILHIFADYDYNLLAFLQTCFLALMVPCLYIFGKSFHSRLFGFSLAGIVLIRQQNAISFSNLINFNATPAQLLTEVPTLLGLILFAFALFFWMKAAENHSARAFVAGGILGAASLIRLNPFLLIPALPVFLFFSMRAHKKEWLFQTASFLLGCAILIVPWVLTGTDQAGQSFFVLKFQDIINVRYGPSGALPSAPPFALALSNPINPHQPLINDLDALSPLSAGLSLPPIDIQTFPGFVINHTLHNFVGSFLTLPDSLRPADQLLETLLERPYWKFGQEWLEPVQIPFVFVNLCLLALGLGWSWKRWRWTGLSPLFVFVIYSLSLGLGRTSGSRYLVPLDWLVDFYFVLGLLSVFQLFPKAFRQVLAVEPENEVPVAPKTAWGLTSAIVAIFCLAALIPLAQTLIPPQQELCAPVNPEQLTSLTPLATSGPNSELVYGEVLYPEIKKDNLSFTLLTCQREVSFGITGFDGKMAVGQRVIAVLSRNESYPSLKLLILPAGPANAAQILWQAASE